MPNAASLATFIGYHGCDYEHVESIKSENFRPSEGPEHLLGDGVYFFVEGFKSDPIENAKKWAVSECFKGNRSYPKYAVLAAVICPRNLLDVTCDEGKEIINVAREHAFNDLPTPVNGCDDYSLLKYLLSFYAFDAIIHDFFFEFKRERILSLTRSSFPNVRVLCVRDPQSAIDKIKINETCSGPTS